MLVVIIGMIVFARIPKLAQRIGVTVIALSIPLAIFYRYQINYDISVGKALEQLLQVCNFNFVTAILILLPNKYIRNYAFYIQSLAAATVFASVSNSFKGQPIYSMEMLSFWYYHLMAFALPLFMMTTKQYKPERKYILPSLIMFIVYLGAVTVICYLLHLYSSDYVDSYPKYSFVYDTYGIPIFEKLYDLIKLPFVYLLPLAPVYYVVCLGITYLYDLSAKIFKRKTVTV